MKRTLYNSPQKKWMRQHFWLPAIEDFKLEVNQDLRYLTFAGPEGFDIEFFTARQVFKRENIRVWERSADAEGDQLTAIGWILHHGYLGAIDKAASIKGLRLRSGNMQVGELNMLDALFVESRFNAWSVGEIHILDQRIVPNGRRDHFEQNIQFRDLVSKLTPTAHELSRLCRRSSLRRNAIRQFEIAYEQSAANLAVIKQGLVGMSEKKRLEKDILKLLKRMEKCCVHSVLERQDKSSLQSRLKRLRTRIQKITASQAEPKAFKRLEPAEKKILEKLVPLIYECSPNKGAARQLIDKILAKI
jgi:hypothetical protein